MKVRLWLAPIVLAVAAGCSPRPPPSILLVVVDTLRADRLGCYGYERPTSPSIDALAASGTLFERAQATSAWTVPSIASLLTGQTPSRHGAGRILRSGGKIVLRDGYKVFHRLDDSVATVASELRKRGYATAAIVSNPFLTREMGLDRGFDHYELLSEAPGSVVTEAALAWLAAADERPFLLLVHYMDPHTPYAPPKNVRGRFADLSVRKLPVQAKDVWRRLDVLTDAERRFISDAYDEEILGVDAEIGPLLEWVRYRRPHALVVLTADHGEELFDHGGFEHGHSLHGEVMHVPLIVAGPGVGRGRISTPVSLVDVSPTLLEAAGLAPGRSAGSSLWPFLRRGAGPQPIRTQEAEGTLYGHEQRALVRWPYKLITELSEPQVRYRLYDLDADPGETRDLASERPDLVEDLSRQLAASVADASRSRVADVEVRMYRLPLEELDALGYLEVH